MTYRVIQQACTPPSHLTLFNAFIRIKIFGIFNKYAYTRHDFRIFRIVYLMKNVEERYEIYIKREPPPSFSVNYEAADYFFEITHRLSIFFLNSITFSLLFLNSCFVMISHNCLKETDFVKTY